MLLSLKKSQGTTLHVRKFSSTQDQFFGQKFKLILTAAWQNLGYEMDAVQNSAGKKSIWGCSSCLRGQPNKRCFRSWQRPKESVFWIWKNCFLLASITQHVGENHETYPMERSQVYRNLLQEMSRNLFFKMRKTDKCELNFTPTFQLN